MPPVSPNQNPVPPVSTMPKKGGSGATVGIIVIVILMLFGALYFWGASLNASKRNNQLPLIPGDATTTSY